MGNSPVKQDAIDLSNRSQNTAATALGTALPLYQQLAMNPQGFTPQQQADMLTASGQSLGGGVASAVGQGALTAGRTNNAGAFSAALDDAARNAGVQQSANSLGIQDQNVALQQQQRAQGLQGLSQIYGQASGNANTSLQAANQAGAPFWQSLLMAGMQGGAQVGAAAVKPCHIAAELYGGWFEPRTLAIRRWLLGPFSDSYTGRLVVRLYSLTGEWFAKKIKTHPHLRSVFQHIFDAALRRALRSVPSRAAKDAPPRRWFLHYGGTVTELTFDECGDVYAHGAKLTVLPGDEAEAAVLDGQNTERKTANLMPPWQGGRTANG